MRNAGSRLGALKWPPLLLQIALLCSALIFVTIAVTWISADVIANDYRDVLSARYGVEMAVAHAMFVDSLHQVLMIAALVGLALTIVASVVIAPNILRPLREMAAQADRVAAGDFGVRVDVDRSSPHCEIHRLGAALNGMAAQLQRLDGARKRMIADLTHDLLTPLTNLRGYIEGLRDGVVAASPGVYSMLEDEIRRLIRLVGDLHQLTLAESARATLRKEHLEVAVLFADSATFIASDLARKSLQVQVDVAPGAQIIEADRDALIRTLRNLLQNAVQHADEASVVKLSAERAGQHMVLTCANSGAPIAPADLTLIFDRFYRVDPARSRGGGAGLGLAIAKELVEAHGGEIVARSDERGTVFSVHLPASGVATIP